MNTRRIYVELDEALRPYLFFWDEWAINGNCNLRANEIELLNRYIHSEFNSEVFDYLSPDDHVDALRNLRKKLTAGYPIFKTYVIVHFLDTVMQMARNYPNGYDAFMNTAISDLEITDELKSQLANFQTYSLKQLFAIYKAGDFYQAWFYYKIVEVQKVCKQQNHLFILNPASP